MEAFAHRFVNPHALGDKAHTRRRQTRHKRALGPATPITSAFDPHRTTKVGLTSPKKWLFSCRGEAAHRYASSGHRFYAGENLNGERLEVGARGRKAISKRRRACPMIAKAVPMAGQQLTVLVLEWHDVGCAGLTGGQRCLKRKRRVHAKSRPVSSEACSQIPCHRSILCQKVMHDQLNTPLLLAACCHWLSLEQSIVFFNSMTAPQAGKLCNGSVIQLRTAITPVHVQSKDPHMGPPFLIAMFS